MKHKLGLGLIVVGAGLEILDLLSHQQVVLGGAAFANTQGSLVNFNEMFGSIHVSYILIGGGLLLRYAL